MQFFRGIPGAKIDLIMHQSLGAEHADGKYARRSPTRSNIADFAVGKFQERHRLVIDLGADRRQFRGDRASFRDLAAKIMQHVELMNRELRQRSARGAIAIPSPCRRRELKRPFVRKIGLHKGDATELAGIDCFSDLADAGHQPRAVPDGYGDAVAVFQRFDLKPVFQRRGDRFLGIDMLLRHRYFARQRQMLFIGYRQNHAFDFRIDQHGLEIGCRRHAHLPREGLTLVFRTAEAEGDLEFVRISCGSRKHICPPAKADNPELYRLYAHSSFIL